MKKVIMKPMQMFGAALSAGILFVACKKDNDNNISQQDQNFMVEAAASNRGEIDLGQLASSQAANVGVKAFGQRMVADHTLALSELMAIGTNWSVTLPTTPDPSDLALKQQLMTRTGYSFDTMYVHSQVLDHQKAITLFQTEVNSGNNADVKAYAAKNLPILQTHLHIADSLWTKLH
jgi:putative membrane protein